jgi:hypothetical protein
MPVRREMVPKFTCTDGLAFLDELDANVHEAELNLRATCDQHGYSAPAFDRGDLYNLLVEHAADFQAALTAYTTAIEARRQARS